ncbi:MAG: phosphatase PAP2 family protein [Deltaproteobacteria bacterium]|nr:phosphatase PAP2 family protein [Deltaproteobacteria bacterium]
MSVTASAWMLAGGILASLALAIFGLFTLFTWLVFRKGEPLWSFLRSVLGSIKQAVSSNPDVRSLIDKHPSLVGFLRRRFSREDLHGWSMTILILAFLYVFLLFMGSIEDFVTKGVILAADVRIANLLYSFRNPHLTAILLWVTLLGNWQIAAGVILTATALLLLQARNGHAAGLWLSVSGSVLFTQLGKLAFHRPPPSVAEYLETSYSFPSGHASIAVGLYGYLIYLLWCSSWSWRRKILLSSLGMTAILAIGFSRIYLGLHYLSDVWSGYLLGAMWLIIGVSVAGVLENRWKGRGGSAGVRQKLFRPAFIGGILLLAAYYGVSGFLYHPPKVRPPDLPRVVVEGNILDTIEQDKVPRYTETVTGAHQEPISFIILARNKNRLIKAFSLSGWYRAMPEGINSLVLAGRAAFFNISDTSAPMTPYFWSGKPHDFGFQKPVPGAGLRQRHHARFWMTRYVDPDGRRIFFGTASLDTGIKWLITHIIGPDIDTERDFLFRDLLAAGQVASWSKEPFTDRGMGRNFDGDPFFTDGNVYVIRLRD